MPLVRICASSTISVGKERSPRGKERERENKRVSRPLVPIGSWLFTPLALPFPPPRPGCRVADRLTAIHFAARTYVRASRSHAGSRYCGIVSFNSFDPSDLSRRTDALFETCASICMKLLDIGKLKLSVCGGWFDKYAGFLYSFFFSLTVFEIFTNG